MKHLIERVLIVIAILVLGTICFVSATYGVIFYRTFSVQKSAAIAMMSQQEQVWLNSLKLVRKGMSSQDVVRILGQPTHPHTNNGYIGWVFDSYVVSFNGILIKFENDQVQSATWVKLNKFYYVLPL